MKYLIKAEHYLELKDQLQLDRNKIAIYDDVDSGFLNEVIKINDSRLSFVGFFNDKNEKGVEILKDSSIKVDFVKDTSGQQKFEAVQTYMELKQCKKDDIVFVRGQLGFNCDYLKTAKVNQKCKFIICPNVTSDCFSNGAYSLVDLWVPPQAISMYEAYFDFCFLYAQTPDAWLTLFNFYSQGERWKGPLGDIIVGLGEHLPASDDYMKMFDRRLFCEQTCLQGRCQLCYNYLQLILTMEGELND